MADGSITVTVSAEAAMHQALIDFAQEYTDKFGVRIKTVDFEWQVIRLIDGESRGTVMGVSVRSEKGVS